MEILNYVWENETLKIISLSLIVLIVITFLILFVVHLIRIKNGKQSKFFWIESTPKEEKIKSEEKNIVKGKNINTGTNYGKIGDN